MMRNKKTTSFGEYMAGKNCKDVDRNCLKPSSRDMSLGLIQSQGWLKSLGKRLELSSFRVVVQPLQLKVRETRPKFSETA